MNTLVVKPRWDIFCRIVDNYGDIGVCWRLASQLAHEYSLTIRLFVDCPQVAQKIIPELSLSHSTQVISGVEICFWDDALSVGDIADVVIEAFACDLPASYYAKIPDKNPIWINLEYLSAESWVDDFHAKASINPINGLVKYFFFPGFNDATGGLLREADLIAKRDEFQSSASSQLEFWQQLALIAPAEKAIKVSLFCYPHAQIIDLLQGMSTGIYPITLFVPDGAILTTVSQFFGVDGATLSAGNVLAKGNLSVNIIPFLSQADYDKLLWSCDINFVRGEDSWLRAIWAAKPFIWQPYFQQEETHLVKLNAFLAHYLQSSDALANNTMRQLSLSWVYEHEVDISNKQASSASLILKNSWDSFVEQLASDKAHAQAYTRQMSEQPDLAAKLVIFCNKLSDSAV